MNSRVTIILVIMAIYLAGMLWIGLKGRKYSETNKDFMTAAKQGSMLLVVGSYLGSHLGNGVVVGGAQYGALYGIGGLWYGAGAALSFVLFALVMSKIVYKKGYLTLPDVLSDRYGGKVVSVLIAILHYCTMIAICAGQIMAGRLLFEYVGLPGTAGAAITFIIVIGYSTMSGLWGVLMTDVVQSGNVKKCAVGKHPKSEKHGNTAQFSEVERSGTQENCGGIGSGCRLRLRPLPVLRRRQSQRVARIDPNAVVVDKNIAENDRFDLFSR